LGFTLFSLLPSSSSSSSSSSFITKKNRDKVQPLHLAAKYSDIEVVQMLLDRKAPLDAKVFEMIMLFTFR
jgi:ankyrin repeat protein